MINCYYTYVFKLWINHWLISVSVRLKMLGNGPIITTVCPAADKGNSGTQHVQPVDIQCQSLGGDDKNHTFWRHSMLVKQSSSFSRKNRIFVSPKLWPPNSLDLNSVIIEFGDLCRNVCTRHPSMTPATWISTSLIHGQAYHKTSSTKQFGSAESHYEHVWRTSAKL